VGADCIESDLSGAVLVDADLTGVNFTRANLTEADLGGARFHSAVFRETTLNGCRLAHVTGLDQAIHLSYSYIDYKALDRSPGLPAIFLQGCGLSDKEINFYGGPVFREYCSSFISFSQRDGEFADKLYRDLQRRGGRCWYYPDDVRIGEDLYDAMSSGLRSAEKTILVLSAASVASPWVNREVKLALAEEIKRDRLVILPLALDNAPFNTAVDWASRLRETRQIGDFRDWKQPSRYRESLERLLTALRRPHEPS
jgi:hypothetical protein